MEQALEGRGFELLPSYQRGDFRCLRVDIVRVQDAGLSRAKDPRVLCWAAREERVLFTHDVNTMPSHAYQRICAGEPTPGLFAVPRDMPISNVIEDMLLIAECSSEGEYEGRVHYLPLRLAPEFTGARKPAFLGPHRL